MEISKDFHSLLSNPDRNLPVLNAKGRAARKSLIRATQQAGSTTNGAVTQILATDEIVADQMVPDPNLAAVLNDQLEIQVGDKFYKVTPQGTFFADAANKAALDAIVNDNALDADDVEPGAPIGGIDTGTYDMGKGVTRFDTFGTATSIELQPITDGAIANGVSGGSAANGGVFSIPCDVVQPAFSQYSAALTAQQYCSFPSYGYGAHTVMGRFLQGIFGVNSDRTENFDSKHRIKVKLYSFNYWVYSSIGLKAKFQQKGWTQIWDKRDCDKIVLGWDAVIFESPLVYSQPSPYASTSFPSTSVGKAIAKETFKFINFEIPATTISEFSTSLLGGYNWNTPSAIEKDFQQLDQQLLSTVSKDLWNYVENKYAPGQIAFQKATTTGFRMIFPDKTTIALSRWEKVSTNTGEVDLIFDWNTCRLSYSGTIGGDFNFAENVLAPTYSNKAFSYTVKKASVYGAALYSGSWKGVRIIQE